MPLEDLIDEVARLARIEYGDPAAPVIHEVPWNEFLPIVAQSPVQARRTIGQYDKPAICQGTLSELDEFETWVTVSDVEWDIKEFNLRHDNTVYDYERGCTSCGSALKKQLEYETTWVFHCPNCKMRSIEDKHVIGGTLGQRGQQRSEK